MSQIDAGDFNPDKSRGSAVAAAPAPAGVHQGAMQALDRFIPRRYKDGISQDELGYFIISSSLYFYSTFGYFFFYKNIIRFDFNRQMVDAISDKWSALRGRSTADCVRIYLTCTRKWPLYGAALFRAKVQTFFI